MVANSENLSSPVLRGSNGCNKLRVRLQTHLQWKKQKLEGYFYHNLELHPCHVLLFYARYMFFTPWPGPICGHSFQTIFFTDFKLHYYINEFSINQKVVSVLYSCQWPSLN